MGVLEEVKRMSEEGMSEQEIASSLKERGLSDNEIQNVFSHARIKAAVFSDESQNVLTQQQSEEKIPSIMNTHQGVTEEGSPEATSES